LARRQSFSTSAQAGREHARSRRSELPLLPPLHPVTGKPCPYPKRGWGFPYSWSDGGRESFESFAASGRIVWGKDEAKIPQYKHFLHEVETNVAKSVFHDYTDGEKQIAALFGETGLFPTPKPTTLPARFVAQTSDRTSLILDFFAGSGTTGHAVIDLNREDGGNRKYILVEMGEYFDTVMKPRIMKVIYSKDWRDGKPVSREGTSHAFKYMKLESYEDALNNVAFTHEREGQEALELYGDDYLLRYMLDFETRGSETLLNVEKISAPFRYKLRLRDGGETRSVSVDLPETFAYLLGLRIRSRKAYHDGGRRYLVYRGQAPNRGEVVAIWHDTEGWDETDFERDKKFVQENSLTEGADEVFVNGDSFILEARPLEGVFNRLMLAGPTVG
jgi:adenine-specific DNA-methyltransferase